MYVCVWKTRIANSREYRIVRIVGIEANSHELSLGSYSVHWQTLIDSCDQARSVKKTIKHKYEASCL